MGSPSIGERSWGLSLALRGGVEAGSEGGEAHQFAGLDSLDEVSWYRSNSGGETHPVGQLKANGYGCYDFSDNVREWCADDDYNPGQHRPGAARRVYRDGGWGRIAGCCRVSARSSAPPGSRGSDLGLRFSRSLD